MSNFPNVLAAVEAREKHLEVTEGRDLWTLADALIKDCGSDDAPAGRPAGAHNGSSEKITQCAVMLEKKGFSYTAASLRDIRAVGLDFPKDRRHAGLSLWIHAEAKSPDFMDWIIKKHGTKKGGRVGIGVDKIRELVRAAKDIERKEREKKFAAAQARMKKASSVAEARQAKTEIEENKGPPKARNLPSPDARPDHPLHAVAALLDISLHISGATKTLRKDLAVINDMGEVDPDHGEEMIRECDALIAVTTQLRNAIRGEKEKGLTVVGGKK